MKVLNILNALESVSGRNDKLSILEANKDNETLKQFFYLALDPLVTFGIKKIPHYHHSDVTLTLDVALDALKKLIDREVTGNAAIDYLTDILSHLYPEDALVVIRAITKDPRCGVAESSVNKVWNGLVFEFPVMKANPYDENTIKAIKFPAISQTKLDGARCCFVVEKDKVVALSSSGREIETHGHFQWMSGLVEGNEPLILDGELLVTEPTGKFMERKKGNGIVNRAVKGTIPVDQAKSLHFVCFDVIPEANWKEGMYNVPYSKRFERIVSMMPKFHTNVSIVETKFVESEREAFQHFKEMLEKGEEGTILKDQDSRWEGKRSKYQIKMKGIITCDLRVVAVEEGTGKNKGKVGALVCRSADGEVEVNVGTGLSDADRARKFDFWLDQIVEVAYNERILSKVEGSKYSLFLPRFVRVRIDKTEADSIENIPLKG